MKFLKLNLLILSFLAAASSTSFAQIELEWQEYGIFFTVPDDFEEGTNNGDQFTAGNDLVYLEIMPWNDPDVSEDNLAELTVALAMELDYDDLTEAEDLDINNYSGCGVNGVKDGLNVVIVTLLDNDSGTNLIVLLAYENERGERQALQILESFYSN